MSPFLPSPPRGSPLFQCRPAIIQSWSAPLWIYLCRYVNNAACCLYMCVSQVGSHHTEVIERRSGWTYKVQDSGSAAFVSCAPCCVTFRLLTHLVKVRESRICQRILSHASDQCSLLQYFTNTTISSKPLIWSFKQAEQDIRMIVMFKLPGVEMMGKQMTYVDCKQ